MGDENFSLEGLTVEEIKRSMAILQAKKIKAYAKRAALTIRIDEAKLASDDTACKIISPEKSRLNELIKKRENVDAYIYALDEVLKQSQRALTYG
jgi:phage-related minor tail protein